MALRVLIVDDEALARSRLRTLLGDCRQHDVQIVGEAANAAQAMALVSTIRWTLYCLIFRCRASTVSNSRRRCGICQSRRW